MRTLLLTIFEMDPNEKEYKNIWTCTEFDYVAMSPFALNLK